MCSPPFSVSTIRNDISLYVDCQVAFERPRIAAAARELDRLTAAVAAGDLDAVGPHAAALGLEREVSLVTES